MYTKKYIDYITLAVVCIILLLINIYYFQVQGNIEKILNENQIQIQNTQETSNEIVKEEEYKTEEKEEIKEAPEIVEEIVEEIIIEDASIDEWYIKIPSIDLIAPIQQGTTTEILNQSVGHFVESPLIEGNVCLAAHNRGYKVNFFEKIKNLLLKDIIIYQYGDIEKVYSVSNVTIIKETDWSYVEEDTKQNKITLITCIENKPEYRLCVQATEI